MDTSGRISPMSTCWRRCCRLHRRSVREFRAGMALSIGAQISMTMCSPKTHPLTANNFVQAASVCAILIFLSQVPEVPDDNRSATSQVTQKESNKYD